jgi:hypothetical protein
MVNTKLLHLDSCNTNRRNKNERGPWFTKYLQVEVVEVLFHLGLVFVTTPSSHTFKNLKHIFGKLVFMQDCINIIFKTCSYILEQISIIQKLSPCQKQNKNKGYIQVRKNRYGC